MKNQAWFVYAVKKNGSPVYVGRTGNMRGRLRRHRVRFGRDIEIALLEEGSGKLSGEEAERKWIEKLKAEGCSLANQRITGAGSWRGRKLRFSKVGERRSARSRFESGGTSWNKGKEHSEETRKLLSEAVSKSLIGNQRRLGIPHTEEMRQHLAAGLKKVAREGGFAAAAKIGTEEMGNRVRRWWDSLTPEAKRDFITRRAEKINAAKAAKKATQ